MTITLSSGQWNVGGSDVCHFAEWPMKTSLHGLSPFPLWLGEWRKLQSLSPQSKLGKHLLKIADICDEEVCWRVPCIYPTPVISPISPQNTRVSCGWARINCVVFILCLFIVLSHWNSKPYLIWQLASLALINMSKTLWPGETGDIPIIPVVCGSLFFPSFICLLCAYVLFLGSSKEWNS